MPRLLRWISHHPFTLAGAAYLIGCGIRFMWIHGFSEWDYVYVLAARYLLHGRNIYDTVLSSQAMGHVYSYPPFMALFAIPFAWLWPGGQPADAGRFIGRFIWFAITAVSTVVLWRGCWRAAGGARLEESPRNLQKSPHPREWIACIIGLLCAGRFIQDNFDHQQADVLIGAILIAGVIAWQRGKAMRCATWFGIAAAIKGPPLLLAPYLLWRGKPGAAAWMLAVTLSLNLLPDAVHRPPTGGLWIGQWYSQMIRPLGQANYRPGEWQSAIINNQSISGLLNRLTSDAAGLPRLSAGRLKFAVLICELALALAAALVMGRPFQRGDDLPDRRERRGIECGIVLLLMLLFSPMSSKPHFCIILLPAMAISRRAMLQNDRLAQAAVAACIVLVDLLDRTIAGPTVGNRAMWFGAVTLAALALLLGSLNALWKMNATTWAEDSLAGVASRQG